MAAKGDIEGIKFVYYSGVKNLHKFSNIDGRTIGHIVSFFCLLTKRLYLKIRQKSLSSSKKRLNSIST
jgi:hypothetical protein